MVSFISINTLWLKPMLSTLFANPRLKFWVERERGQLSLAKVLIKKIKLKL
jgi:hypothetical protein